MFVSVVTANNSAPKWPSMTAYMAESAAANIIGPDSVPPGRTMVASTGMRIVARPGASSVTCNPAARGKPACNRR